MNKTDITCPICGTINHDLYLEETDGWMECEHCLNVLHVKDFALVSRIPIYKSIKWQMAVPLASNQ